MSVRGNVMWGEALSAVQSGRSAAEVCGDWRIFARGKAVELRSTGQPGAAVPT